MLCPPSWLWIVGLDALLIYNWVCFYYKLCWYSLGVDLCIVFLLIYEIILKLVKSQWLRSYSFLAAW